MRPSAADEQRYVYQGRLVEKKPFSIWAFFSAIIDFFRLFFLTMVTSQSQDEHINEYKASKRGGQSWSGGARVTGFAKAAQHGCSGGG